MGLGKCIRYACDDDDGDGDDDDDDDDDDNGSIDNVVKTTKKCYF